MPALPKENEPKTEINASGKWQAAELPVNVYRELTHLSSAVNLPQCGNPMQLSRQTLTGIGPFQTINSSLAENSFSFNLGILSAVLVGSVSSGIRLLLSLLSCYWQAKNFCLSGRPLATPYLLRKRYFFVLRMQHFSFTDMF